MDIIKSHYGCMWALEGEKIIYLMVEVVVVSRYVRGQIFSGF